jgi:recombination protein RecA
MVERSVLDVLKRLNKDKADEDKIKLASNQPEEYFVRSIIPTGSPYLDYKINSTLGKGGLVKGSYNMFVGGEGSGKSSLALSTAAQEQKQTGKYVVYFDGEGTVSDSYIDRMGVDRKLFIHISGRNLEEMLDSAQEFSLSNDVGMIIIDSIPIFVSTVIENKSAEDNNMAVEARKFTARMPIIEGNCRSRGIALLGLSFYTLDPGANGGDPRILKRGVWQKLMSNLTVDLSKKDIIKDGNGKPIGHVIEVRLKKSKLQAYDPKEVFRLNFYYDYGFDKFDEYSSVLIEEGIVKQGGAWYTFPNENGEEIKQNGKSKVITYLKENPTTFDFLISKIGAA